MRIFPTKLSPFLSQTLAREYPLVKRRLLVSSNTAHNISRSLRTEYTRSMDKQPIDSQDHVAVQSTIENENPVIFSKDMSQLPPGTEDRLQAPTPLDENGNLLSKNKLKKLKKDQEWDANRAKRKAKRKEKDQEKKGRKRAAAAAAAAVNATRDEGAESEPKRARLDSDLITKNEELPSSTKERSHQKRLQHVQLPVTFVLDCGFDDLMTDTEAKSLSSQITRSYSDCHRAPYQAKMLVCSFTGRLKDRFERVLACNHKSWKGVTFLEEDFTVAAEHARKLMNDDKGDGRSKMAAAFAKCAVGGERSKEAQSPQVGEVVYLTSDSENSLSELKPYSTYIVGGLVDRNRHKGICYKRAMDKGFKTAKLPIGEYMQMQSRFVLATNHVVEIMLRWLECGDWGEAFLKVIPKRKGGSLRINQSVSGEGNGIASEQEEPNGCQESAAIDAQKEYEDTIDKDEVERKELDEEGPDVPERPPQTKCD